jgi:drug/metabolite transporter (DMT)-like permease
MKTKRAFFSPYLALTAGIIALSMTSIFVRWAEAPGTVTAAYRMAISALVLTPFALKSKGKAPQNYTKWFLIILLAGTFVALDHGSLNTAIGLTRIANCTLLNNIETIWVALFALIFWREKLRVWFWVGLSLTLGGAMFILGSDLVKHPTLGFGDGLAFLSSFFYAGYFLITQVGRTRFSALRYIWAVNLVSAVLLFLYNLISGIPVTGFNTQTYLIFIAAGVFSQTIGYLSVAYALGHLPASIVAPTMVIQIVLTSILAIPLTGESLSIMQLIGGVAVLGGIMLVNLTRNSPGQELTRAVSSPQSTRWLFF